jgi:sulfate adenylyltransferase subunit 1 (EFTu-like GTPase family)
MVTGASTADVAVILVDARKGVLTQTRRHSYLVSPDRHPQRRAGHQQDGPRRLRRATSSAASSRTTAPSPASSASRTITHPDVGAQGRQHHRAERAHMPWYHGPTLMGISRPSRSTTTLMQRSRSAAGAVGQPPEPRLPRLRRHDRRRQVAPGRPRARAALGRESTVARIVTADGDLPQAVAGQSVTLTLADEIDISRGDVISDRRRAGRGRRPVRMHLVWMHDEPMLPAGPTCSRSARAR